MRYLPFVLLIFLCSCYDYNKDIEETYVPIVTPVSKDNSEVIEKEYTLYQEVYRDKVLDIEPKDKIYFGVSLDNNYYNNDFEKFQKDINKELSLEVVHIDFSVTEEFIQEKLIESMLSGKIPYFILKYDRLIKYDMAEIYKLSRKLASINYYSFLEVYPLDDRDIIDTTEYKKFFIESYKTIKRNAPLCNVVYPTKTADSLSFMENYVGDSNCDFVSIYTDIDGARVSNPLASIDYTYFSVIKKPVVLSLSISYFDESQYGYDFENYRKNLEYCLSDIIYDYGNVKAMVYFNHNIDYSQEELYNLESSEEAFEIFKEVLKDEAIITKIVKGGNDFELIKLPFNAIYTNDLLYVDTRFFKDFTSKEYEKIIYRDSNLYIDIDSFIKRLGNNTVVVNSAENKIVIK